MAKKVIVALSGGVDSSVAAALLQRQGFDVEGVFMKNWSPDTLQSLTDCPWETDQTDAAAVCEHLGIPFRSINFEKEYKERVVDYFLREYAAGRTPNPDIMCNKEIKFAVFLDEAMKSGADFVATGHYAQVEGGSIPRLLRGVDAKKDQSYFLHSLSSEQMANILLPLGGMEKAEVRRLAEEFKLPTATKKDSQGICFIGHIDLKEFRREQLGAHEGSVYLVPDYDGSLTLEQRIERALLVGKHQGSMFYTLGERARSNIDNRLYRIILGETDVKPCYILARQSSKNALYVTRDHNDPHLYSTTLTLERLVYTGTPMNAGEVSSIDALISEGIVSQVRYHGADVQVKAIRELENGRVEVETDPQWAASVGQSLVLYHGNQVLGGGVICATK